MLEARTGDQSADGGKVNESSRASKHAPQVELNTFEENGNQTLISFTGIGIDAGVLAIPDTGLSHDDALEIVHDVVDAAGGVA